MRAGRDRPPRRCRCTAAPARHAPACRCRRAVSPGVVARERHVVGAGLGELGAVVDVQLRVARHDRQRTTRALRRRAARSRRRRECARRAARRRHAARCPAWRRQPTARPPSATSPARRGRASSTPEPPEAISTARSTRWSMRSCRSAELLPDSRRRPPRRVARCRLTRRAAPARAAARRECAPGDQPELAAPGERVGPACRSRRRHRCESTTSALEAVDTDRATSPVGCGPRERTR